MAESVDIPLPAEMLESLGLFKAAHKELMEQIKQLRKDMKAVEKEGRAIPAEMQERLKRLDEHRTRIIAQQAAKDATDASIRHVSQKFSEFRGGVSEAASMLRSGSTTGNSMRASNAIFGPLMDSAMAGIGGALGIEQYHMATKGAEELRRAWRGAYAEDIADLSRPGARRMLSAESRAAEEYKLYRVISSARNTALADAPLTQKFMGQVANISDRVSAVRKAAAIGEDMWLVRQAAKPGIMGDVASILRTGVGKAGAAAIPAAILLAVHQGIVEQTAAYNIEADTNRINAKIQETLFETRNIAQFSSQRSIEELREQDAGLQHAAETVGTNWFSPSEIIHEASDSVLGYIPGVYIANRLFGLSGAAEQNKRRAEAKVQEIRYGEMSRRLGKNWEKANNVKQMMDDARKNPNSVLARIWATQHTAVGGAGILGILRGYAFGPTDEELRELGEARQKSVMDSRVTAWAAEEKRVKLNPWWRSYEHERELWVDEVGRHRYERTLQWSPI